MLKINKLNLHLTTYRWWNIYLSYPLYFWCRQLIGKIYANVQSSSEGYPKQDLSYAPAFVPIFSVFFFSCSEYMYFVHWSMAQALLDGRLFKKEEESFNHKSRNFSQTSDSTLCFICKWCILAFVKQNPGPIQDSAS